MNTLIRSPHTPVHRAFSSGTDDVASALMKSGLVAFALVDSGSIIAASPALRELLGSTTPYHTIDGQSLLSIVDAGDRPAVSEFCASLTRESTHAQHNCRLLHADGASVPALLRGALITVDERIQLVLVVTDLAPCIGDTPAGDRARLLDAFDRNTGFANRALLLDRTRIALAAARRYRRRAAMLRIDLEHLD